MATLMEELLVQSGVHHMEWLSRVLIRVSTCATTKHVQATVFLVLSGIRTTVLLNPSTCSLSSSNALVMNTQSNTIKKALSTIVHYIYAVLGLGQFQIHLSLCGKRTKNLTLRYPILHALATCLLCLFSL